MRRKQWKQSDRLSRRVQPASDCKMCTTKVTKERSEGKKAVIEIFLPFVNFVSFVVQPLPQMLTPLAMLLMDQTADRRFCRARVDQHDAQGMHCRDR